MAVNKVQTRSGTVLMDTSSVTVKAETLGKGETALDAAGKMIVGIMEVGGSVGNCAVTISAGASVDNSVANVLYTREEDGKLVAVQGYQGVKSVTVEIASGSFFAVVFNTMNGASVSNGTELISLAISGNSLVLFAKVTAAAGESASLSME